MTWMKRSKEHNNLSNKCEAIQNWLADKLDEDKQKTLQETSMLLELIQESDE